MSNRGRHKKKLKKIKNNILDIVTINLIYSELENFKTNYNFNTMRLNFKVKDECLCDNFGYDVSTKMNIVQLINFLAARKDEGFNYVRIPNSNIIKDKYYAL